MSTQSVKTTGFTLTLPADNEVLVTCSFKASREAAFDAYTNPQAIPLWWGPRRLTTKVESLDARDGGKWRFIQHDQDGKEHAFNGVYREVLPPEKIVQTFEYEGMKGHLSTETVTFEKQNRKTKVLSRIIFQSKADRDGMIQTGMEEGMAESMERLAEYLENRK
jgi:uncharacterized protein YndB with AHSA1/START domain